MLEQEARGAMHEAHWAEQLAKEAELEAELRNFHATSVCPTHGSLKPPVCSLQPMDGGDGTRTTSASNAFGAPKNGGTQPRPFRLRTEERGTLAKKQFHGEL